MARAFALQAKGYRFESVNLHKQLIKIMKFRGKCGNKWVYDKWLLCKRSNYYLVSTCNYKQNETLTEDQKIDLQTLGEITEIKDDSGISAYEGDVITYKYGDSPNTSISILKLVDGKLNILEDKSISYISDIKIVGNIYDNPELTLV